MSRMNELTYTAHLPIVAGNVERTSNQPNHHKSLLNLLIGFPHEQALAHVIVKNDGIERTGPGTTATAGKAR